MGLVALTKFELEEKSETEDGRTVHGGEGKQTHVFDEGQAVTKAELKAAGQTDDEIAELISRGVVGEA